MRNVLMTHAWQAAALICSLVSIPVQACRTSVQIKLEDVKFADVVVVGIIVKYAIVRDEEFRKRMLGGSRLPADMQKIYKDPNQTLISDYARFDVVVNRTLKGTRVPSRFSATWDNSTFGEPKTLDSGPYVLAFRQATSKVPPLRGPSATIMANPDPKSLAVLQAPCAAPFMFLNGTREALEVEKIIRLQRR